MRLAIGSDHRGFELAQHLAERLRTAGHEVELHASEPGTIADYPEPAYAVAQRIVQGHVERGVLICGTGLGMSIAANKIPGIRAAAVHDEITAELSRANLDANICCLSADLLGVRLVEKIVDAWLERGFDGGRHARRLEKVRAIERGEAPDAPRPTT